MVSALSAPAASRSRRNCRRSSISCTASHRHTYKARGAHACACAWHTCARARARWGGGEGGGRWWEQGGHTPAGSCPSNTQQDAKGPPLTSHCSQVIACPPACLPACPPTCSTASNISDSCSAWLCCLWRLAARRQRVPPRRGNAHQAAYTRPGPARRGRQQRAAPAAAQQTAGSAGCVKMGVRVACHRDCICVHRILRQNPSPVLVTTSRALPGCSQ